MNGQNGEEKRGLLEEADHAVKSSAEKLLAGLRARRKVDSLMQDKEHQADCAARLEKWGASFDEYAFAISIVRSATRAFHSQRPSIPSLHRSIKGTYVSAIQSKIIELAEEILLLTRHGYVSGAVSRARTIYETAIIMRFLAGSSEDTARRYRDHYAVKAFEDSVMPSPEPGGAESSQWTHYQSLKSNYDLMIQKYGEEFKSSYGWAKPGIQRWSPGHKGRVRFADIETIAGGSHFNSLFRFASHSVHMTPMTFNTEYFLIKAPLGKPGFVGVWLPAHLSLSSLLASLSSLLLLLELMPAIANSEMAKVEDLYFEMRVYVEALNTTYVEVIKSFPLTDVEQQEPREEK